jgi:hypothetical protein
VFISGLKTSVHDATSPAFFTQPTNNYFVNIVKPVAGYFTYYAIEKVVVSFVPAELQTGGANQSFGRNQMLIANETVSPENFGDWEDFGGTVTLPPTEPIRYSWSPSAVARSR